jgi:hypothetical protein
MKTSGKHIKITKRGLCVEGKRMSLDEAATNVLATVFNL